MPVSRKPSWVVSPTLGMAPPGADARREHAGELRVEPRDEVLPQREHADRADDDADDGEQRDDRDDEPAAQRPLASGAAGHAAGLIR